MDTYANASDHPPSREIAAKIMAARGRGLSPPVLGKYNKYNVASRRRTPRAVVRLLPYLARVFKEERKTVTFPLIIDITCRETRRDVSQRESPCPE